MKTVAVLRSNPKDAAMNRVCLSLAREYKVICLVWDRQGDFHPFGDRENIQFIRFTLSAGFYDLRTLLKLLLFQIWLAGKLLVLRYDAVHAIDLDTVFPALAISLLKRKRTVYQCLDPYYAALPPAWPALLGRLARWLEVKAINAADLFIISDLLRLPQHTGARPRKLVELANVPTQNISPEPYRQKGDFVAGYLGSLVAGRNLELIVDCCGNLAEKGIRLVIGGFGIRAELLKKMVQPHKNIEFHSWLPYEELLRIESTFDLFLHICDPENEAQRWVSPNKLFESMAFARPIIVAQGTLAAQRVEKIGNGVAVPYGDRKALEETIVYFKDNLELSREMGRKGRLEFERNWQPAIMKTRLLKAYNSIWSDK